MNVLITGAKGQVGSEICQLARSELINMIATGKEELDITDSSAVISFFHECKPDIVINASAYTAVDKAEDDSERAYAINHQGASNLASACTEYHIPLLHISTDYVFNGEAASNYKEDDEVSPLGIYGDSKLQAENTIQEIMKKFIILRVAWVFGIHGNNFVKTMIRLANTHNTVKVVNDQFGGPTPAREIARVLLALVKQYQQTNTLDWGIYHYCGQPKVSWFEFADTIFTIAKEKELISAVNLLPITTEEFPTRVTRPANSMLDCDKIKNTYNIEPADWKHSLSEMLDELKQEPE